MHPSRWLIGAEGFPPLGEENATIFFVVVTTGEGAEYDGKVG